MRYPLAIAFVLLTSCDGGEDPVDTELPPRAYAATIRWTEGGVPHILADDIGSAAFGQGYALARDHGCVLADMIVKVRSERSRYFGAGQNNVNLNSDFGYKALRVYPNARDALPELSPEARDLVRGYARGYSHYIETHGTLPGTCAGEPWVVPISETDLLAYYLDVVEAGSGRPMLPYLGNAQPPGSADLPHVAPPIEEFPNVSDLPIGSNGWGIGGDRTVTGRGAVLGNPHFPWEAEMVFWESHITVPGEIDAYGAGLIGVAGVLIGFNEHVAWTHTVSGAPRFTLYRLELDPADSTAYLYDGEYRSMARELALVEVLQDDGSMQVIGRWMYRTHYGPVLNAPVIGWGPNATVAMRDVNEGNVAILDQFIRMDKATDLDEFKAAHAEVNAIPWVNTMYADAEGNAWYTDSSNTPNLSQATLDDWKQAQEDDPLVEIFADLGVPLLPGTTSDTQWVDAGGRAPGMIPFEDAPQLLRSDFVCNANESHWLTNPYEPLEGYHENYGDERTRRGPRTRMNLVLLTEVDENGASGADGLFDLDEIADAALANRALIAELALDGVIASRCTGDLGVVEHRGEQVDLDEACAVLEGWSGRLDIDAVGATLWREMVAAIAYGHLVDEGDLFAVGWDVDDPFLTPHTVADPPAEGDDPILVALAEAVVVLGEAGVDIHEPLGDVQYTLKGSDRIPIHGGNGREGATNIVDYSTFYKTTRGPAHPYGSTVSDGSGLTDIGYPINYGTSFLMAMMFTDDGPTAKTILAMSASSDPASDHYADQTWAFSNKEYKTVRFTEADIAASPELVIEEIAWEP